MDKRFGRIFPLLLLTALFAGCATTQVSGPTTSKAGNGVLTSAAELARKEAIAQKSLAFARDNDLSPSLIEWHSDRLRLIQDRIRKIAA